MKKAQYKTRQLLEIEDFLKNNENKHVTVNDIILFFKQQGKNIGKATVYRHLDRMVSDGTVHKYMLETGDSACFEYVEGEDVHPVCFHCKCEKCGKLIHLECTEYWNRTKYPCGYYDGFGLCKKGKYRQQ